MRTLTFTAMLSLTSLVTSLAQGTLEFQNVNAAAGVNAPVYGSDRVTKLSGSQFQAELLVGSDASSLVSIATTGFLTGNGAGYFIAPVQTIPNTGPGASAFVQVEVWNTATGSSFSQAEVSGLPNSWWASSTFKVTLGGGVINPLAPTALIGLGNSPVYLNSVPEPSAVVLAGLGAGLAWLGAWRRRGAGLP